MKINREDEEYELMVKFIADIRDVIFDDAPESTQVDMVGSPLAVLLYAKAWIQDAREEIAKWGDE